MTSSPAQATSASTTPLAASQPTDLPAGAPNAPGTAPGTFTNMQPESDEPDPYLWLEAVDSAQALAWVRERNALSRAQLEADPGFAPLRKRLLEVLDSQERIPSVTRRGEFFYNFWRDATHPRGLWRRCNLQSFLQQKPLWETVLDLDALAQAEGENWVWAGAQALGGASACCWVQLSRGGADATVLREFDLRRKTFVPNGFTLPEAKSWGSWLDEDTLLMCSDTGPGSLTQSGYPREVRLWRRGTALADAPVLLRAQAEDVMVNASVHRHAKPVRVVLSRSLDFYRQRQWLWQDAELHAIDKPDDADLSFWRDQVLIQPRQDWWLGTTLHPAGSLLAGPAAAYLRGERHGLQRIFSPTPTRSLQGWVPTAQHLVLDVLDQVLNRLECWQPTPGGGWQGRELPMRAGALSVQALHDPQAFPGGAQDPLAEQLLITGADFLTPDTLYLASTSTETPQALQARPAFFSAQGMTVVQRSTTSADGTPVPYFVIYGQGCTADNGPHPTLLYGYGGFEVSLQPWYLAGAGRAWLSRGGVFVLANIRGGGEFGPAWHRAAILENKQRSYDDFIAVAQALIASGITTPAQLGIQGGSNGGLLVGAVMVQRPELFGAVVCQVPLLDMRRYHQLLAGASWMAEYGNPDEPAQWAYIRRYSPYQNVRAGVRYPALFINTSTRDDRVHPAHARKMAARMLAQGHPVLYHEHIEGGHGGGADNTQQADRQALEYSFLWQQLGGR